MPANTPANYAKRGKNLIDGWFARSDAEIFLSLLAHQSTHGHLGAIAEIGVHHGKSFIMMALANDGNKCYAIDIFGQQKLNVDRSGKGDKNIFLRNLARFEIAPDRVVIDERLSSDVTPQDIIGAVEKISFFHVDGGHHLAAIAHDLILAEAVMTDHGIIAVDDVFRPEWPEVSMGTFLHLGKSDCELVIFAIGFNKSYLCHKSHAKEYQAALLKNDFLRMFLAKKYQVSRNEILVFQHYPLPEWGITTRVRNYLKTYHPDFAYLVSRIVRRIRN